MSYYKFGNDIYIVKGAVKHCIYDLSLGNLYNINQGVLDFINNLINVREADLNLTFNEKQILNQLIQTKLLLKSPDKESVADISSLRKKTAPSFCWIEVTRQCNLSCSFCYEKSNPHCEGKMSIDDFYSIIDELKNIGIKKIQFIGGEPLLLKSELKAMIKHCRSYFDFIEVYTNGTLINDDWANFFNLYNISIALSIHSYLPEEHDRITTVIGSHKKVLRGLELLKKYKVKYRIGTVRSSDCNIGNKQENSGYSLRPKEPKVVGRTNLSQYNLEMFKRKAITKNSKSYPIKKQQVITSISGNQCFIKNLYISCQLEVYPCVMERRISHGNLKKNKLKNLLNENIRFLSKDNIEGCKDCEFRYACFDCRPDSNGQGVYEKPWYCTYDPKIGKWYDVDDMFKKITDLKDSIDCKQEV